MALVAVLCSKCSHIGFARADALPRVLVCSRCHRQQRFEPRPLRAIQSSLARCGARRDRFDAVSSVTAQANELENRE
jgi:hypothetical protein